MIRGLAKGAILAMAGATKSTKRLYRTATREWMETQATHVDKLARAWPGYVEVWRSHGIELPGATVWIHDGGWTPFPFFVNHLVAGTAGIVTNTDGRMLDRYLVRAINGAIECRLPEDSVSSDRLVDLERLRWADSIRAAVDQLGGKLLEGVDVGAIPLDDNSVDLCHSGGTLEHYTPSDLEDHLTEAARILRPGGTMSHVFDHRDHLHHADPDWSFLNHYGRSDWAYAVTHRSRLLFHNRLLPDEVCAAFEGAGFERVALRRMTLPDRSWIDDGESMSHGDLGIERPRLASRFRSASDDDLRTAAAHYIYRSPL